MKINPEKWKQMSEQKNKQLQKEKKQKSQIELDNEENLI